MTTDGNFNVNNINTVKMPTIQQGIGVTNVPVNANNGIVYDSKNVYYLDSFSGNFYVAPFSDPMNAVLRNNLIIDVTTQSPTNTYNTAIGSYFYAYGGAAATVIWAAHKDTPASWFDTGLTSGTANFPMIYFDGSNIYLLGGTSLGSSVTDISVAAIGSPTTFVLSGGTLPAPRENAAIAVVGSTIYMYGGLDSGNSQNTIFSAPTSTPTVWTDTLATLPQHIDSATSYVDANYVYLFGGEDTTGAVNLDTIYRAPIGTPTTFTLASNLPFQVSNATLIVSHGYMYLVGGSIGGSTGLFRASVSDPLTWVAVPVSGQIATAQANTHVAIQGGQVYAFGGFNSGGAASTVIQSADANTPIIWKNEAAVLPAALYGGEIIKTKSYYYIIGGDFTGNYYRAPLATPTVWTLAGTGAPTHRHGKAVIVDDQVWYFGGEDVANTPFVTGWRGLIVDGEIVHWLQDPNNANMKFQLPTALSRFSLVQAGDYIYAIGGTTTAGFALNSNIYRTRAAELNNTVSYVTWLNVGTLSNPSHGASVAVINNQLYLIGGTTAANITTTDDYIIRADMTDLANGNAIFVEENSAAQALAGSKAICVNDDLYLVGGRTTTNGTTTLYRNLSWATHRIIAPKVFESSAGQPTLDLKTGALGSYSSFHKTGLLSWLVSDK